jgi:uncharacterized protein HemY
LSKSQSPVHHRRVYAWPSGPAAFAARHRTLARELRQQLLGRPIYKVSRWALPRARQSRFRPYRNLWFELGNAACGELDFAQANHAYRRALDLAPNNASLYSP